MKTVAGSVSTYLATFPTEFLMADAYTFTLANGTVLRWTNAQQDFKLGANTWSSVGPVIERSSCRQVLGVEVDTLDLTVAASSSLLVAGVTLLQALRSGVFDGATCLLNRVFFTASGVLVNSTGTGDLILFSGQVADVEVGRTSATIRVNSFLQLLQTQLPRNTYQPGCLNTVYDSGCTLVKATYAVTGTALSGSTATALNVSMAQSAGYFDQGVLAFTSGPNNGLTRTVRAYTGGVMTLVSPFPSVPASGNTFTVRPGCDKSQATCTSKFANQANFRGQPYVPVITSVVNV